MAPDVYEYWEGSLPYQDGGHGDADGFPALDCTGTMGCHDTEGALLHNNGTLETSGAPSENTFHLQGLFISSDGDPPWAVAETINTACAETCHPAYGVSLCSGNGHSVSSDIPYTPRFGYSLTPADADGSEGPRNILLPTDSDVTTNASAENPDYALCISCHDPHGSGAEGAYGVGLNVMVRLDWGKSYLLCNACHMTPPAPEEQDSDEDGLLDEDETGIYLTDPFDSDTDDDGMEDGAEVSLADGGSCPDPLDFDSDDDFVTDGQEISLGTDPCDSDTDKDGIPDGIDPYPVDPDGTAEYISGALLAIGADFSALDPSFFPGSGRSGDRHHSHMAALIEAAADDTGGGDFRKAAGTIERLLKKLHGPGGSTGWMAATEERESLSAELIYLHGLLGYLL